MINNYKLSIVTPNLNGGKYLEQTIKSVINQDYKNIEYIIIDGGSTDNSIEIIKKYSNYISYYEIKKDNNMYEALNYGFKKASGDIFTWLNSDDLYYKNCLSKIMNKIQKKNYKWINCISSSIKNDKISTYHIPFFFPKNYIEKGKCHKSDYGFIPQESIFFTKELYFNSGEISKKYRYAGDFYLWKNMALIEKMYPINNKCGIFRKHPNQLSKNMQAYYKDINKNYSYKKNYLRILFSIIYLCLFFYKT